VCCSQRQKYLSTCKESKVIANATNKKREPGPTRYERVGRNRKVPSHCNITLWQLLSTQLVLGQLQWMTSCFSLRYGSYLHSTKKRPQPFFAVRVEKINGKKKHHTKQLQSQKGNQDRTIKKTIKYIHETDMWHCYVENIPYFFINYESKKSVMNCNYYVSDMNQTKLQAIKHSTTIQIYELHELKSRP
jgi:hypothetical protein